MLHTLMCHRRSTVLSFPIDIQFEDLELMIPSFQLGEGLRLTVFINRTRALATLFETSMLLYSIPRGSQKRQS